MKARIHLQTRYILPERKIQFKAILVKTEKNSSPKRGYGILQHKKPGWQQLRSAWKKAPYYKKTAHRRLNRIREMLNLSLE